MLDRPYPIYLPYLHISYRYHRSGPAPTMHLCSQLLLNGLPVPSSISFSSGRTGWPWPAIDGWMKRETWLPWSQHTWSSCAAAQSPPAALTTDHCPTQQTCQHNITPGQHNSNTAGLHQVLYITKVIWKRGKQSWHTALLCFARMIGDIRMNIEKQQAENCTFTSFLHTRNEGKSGSTIADDKFAKLLRHTEPTLPSAILEKIILLTPPTCVTAEDADAA